MTAPRCNLAGKADALPAGLVAAFEGGGTFMRVAAGSLLITPEERAGAVYRLLAGRVQVALLAPDGGQVILRDLGPGEIFGELAAIDGGPRSAWVFAAEDCALWSLEAGLFREAAFATPAAALWLARRLVALARELTGRVFDLNTLRPGARLQCEILRLCGARGLGAQGLVIEPAPTHAEFAARIGAQRETVTRELGELARRGVIEVGRRRLAVVDLPALVALARAAAGQSVLDARGAGPLAGDGEG